MICWLNPACLLLITHMFVDSRLCFLVKSLFIFCGMLWRYEIPMVVSLKKKNYNWLLSTAHHLRMQSPDFTLTPAIIKTLFSYQLRLFAKKKSCCKSISSSDPWCIMRHKSHNQPHYVPICRPLFVTNYDVYTVYIYIYIYILLLVLFAIHYLLFIIYYIYHLLFFIYYYYHNH